MPAIKPGTSAISGFGLLDRYMTETVTVMFIVKTKEIFPIFCYLPLIEISLYNAFLLNKLFAYYRETLRDNKLIYKV